MASRSSWKPAERSLALYTANDPSPSDGSVLIRGCFHDFISCELLSIANILFNLVIAEFFVNFVLNASLRGNVLDVSEVNFSFCDKLLQFLQINWISVLLALKLRKVYLEDGWGSLHQHVCVNHVLGGWLYHEMDVFQGLAAVDFRLCEPPAYSEVSGVLSSCGCLHSFLSWSFSYLNKLFSMMGDLLLKPRLWRLPLVFAYRPQVLVLMMLHELLFI